MAIIWALLLRRSMFVVVVVLLDELFIIPKHCVLLAAITTQNAIELP